MLEGVSVPSLICMLLGGFLAILCRFLTVLFFADSAMCVALLVQKMSASSGSKSHRKSFKSESGRVQKLSKMRPGRVGGVLGALGFINAEKRADKDEKWSHFGATWSICVPFWRPLDFEGPIR